MPILRPFACSNFGASSILRQQGTTADNPGQSWWRLRRLGPAVAPCQRLWAIEPRTALASPAGHANRYRPSVRRNARLPAGYLRQHRWATMTATSVWIPRATASRGPVHAGAPRPRQRPRPTVSHKGASGSTTWSNRTFRRAIPRHRHKGWHRRRVGRGRSRQAPCGGVRLTLERLYACGGNADHTHRRVAQYAARNGRIRNAAQAVSLVCPDDDKIDLFLARHLD